MPIPNSALSLVGGAFRVGVEHILTGWDHLLFLLALLLGARSVRAIVLAVSAFTVAHSMTLALAALGVVTPSAWLVEAAIAGSIAYVAFDTAWRRAASHRAWLAFAFGLVHGLGLAGALRGLALGADRLLPSLLGFNAGVEVGQLAVIAALAPFLAWLARGRLGGDRFVRVASIAVGCVGLAVLVARIAARG